MPQRTKEGTKNTAEKYRTKAVVSGVSEVGDTT
jgi:hypothetical protein